MIRRTFAPPFVITAACGAPHATAPQPPAAKVIDAAVAIAPDAAPPDAGLAKLVRANGDDCYQVPGGTYVACPAGGPTIVLPAVTRVSSKSFDIVITLGEDSLKCSHRVGSNPPHYDDLDHCPTMLLPSLTGGARPTRTEDRHCYYGEVEVRCHPDDDAHPIDLTGATIEAEIIAIDVEGAGSAIAFNRGAKDGITVGARGSVVGVADSTFVVTRCSDNECWAKVAVDPDRVNASGKVAAEYLPEDR